MIEKIKKYKEKMGEDLLILAHHYQNDDIIKIADFVGDSLKLAQVAEKNKTAKYIVFCGVHFMAETADILTEDFQRVLMPDLKAGCPMADMADAKQAEKAFKMINEKCGGKIIPITYINSKAEVKAFCGRNGGATVTSSNADKIVKWAINEGDRVLFLPDQNLGKNTALKLGVKENEIALYNPLNEKLTFNGDYDKIKIILWDGYCHVHHNVNESSVDELREKYKNIKIIVHPECKNEVVKKCDMAGSTDYIIKALDAAEDGGVWGIGTEKKLVERLAEKHSDKKIILLQENMLCVNMSITNLKSLLETLEEIEEENFKRQVTVDEKIADDAKKALNKMLDLS